jgi:DNA-binding winged helix-turn-helix (wHTH) protein/predicted ATPase
MGSRIGGEIGAGMRDRQFVFASFRLDPANQRFWQDEELVALRPKVFAVLHRLVEHAGRLVTREELRAAVWGDTVVSESVLRGTIRELREVLGDDANAARLIETVPHRGYRFISPVEVVGPTATGSPPMPRTAPRGLPRSSGSILIGRDAELDCLRAWLVRALGGARQVVFVTGEPGIGKTTVVDAFLASIAEIGDVCAARGQCVEHYGASEAYLPVLEALGQLCQQPGRRKVIALLERHAPTWLAQMPALIGNAELETLLRRAQGATRERMLRELAEALDALAALEPVVLVLEDLHWSDYSTLDLISLLAQRRTPARLLVLGTYRPADVIISSHPLKALKQELSGRQLCEELPLGFLSDVEVSQYLSVRFPQQQLPPELARVIHHTTEGNPLFVVNLVDYCVSQRLLVECAGVWCLAASVEDVAAGVPESLRQMIDKQLGRLTVEECRLLEAASVAGIVFSTAAVASALEENAERVEDSCEGLARRQQFIHARGTEALADETLTGRYGFLHALYHQVLYERVAAARRVRLHRRIGEWGEASFGPRVRDAAAELAMHFERGNDQPRAIEYLSQAADNAMRRKAPHEAVELLNRSLALLKNLPASPAHAQHELALLVAIGVPLLMTRGYAAEEVERTYARAQELCGQMYASPQLLPALAGLFRFHLVRADLQTARVLAEKILRLAESIRDPVFFLVAHSLLGVLSLSLGLPVAGREHLEKGIALYSPEEHGFMASLYGDDPGVTCHCFAAMCLWLLGYPEQALTNVQMAVTAAKGTGSPYSEAFALDFVTWTHVLCRHEDAAQKSIDALTPIATEHGFRFLLADCKVLHGWVVAAQGMKNEGLQLVHEAIVAYEATGALMSRPAHLMLLATVHGRLGQTEEGLATVARALSIVEQTGERTYEAELLRLQGELTLGGLRRTGRKRQVRPGTARAEACFRNAIEVAKKQQAKSLELRAVTSLSRLLKEQGERQQAHGLLSAVYGWFTEGFDTADLQEARALLAELG